MTSIVARRLRAVGLVLAAAAALGLPACGGSSGGAQGDRSLVYGALGGFNGFNVHSQASAALVTSDVVENLFFYAVKQTPDLGLEFVGLAEPPRVVSTSPHVVEYRIRDDAVWSDGSAVTAEDLRYFHAQVVDPGNDALSREGYEQITSLQAVGERAVRATFDPPYADYEGLWGGVFQAAYVKANGGWSRALAETPGPSAGPFQFEEWRPDESLTLVRNPRWWGRDPGLERIVFRFVDELGSLAAALRNGEIDMATTQPQLDVVQEARGLAGFRVEVATGPRWEHLTFNLGTPALSDLRVRQAIAHAVDRNAVVDALLRPVYDGAARLDNFAYMTNQPEYVAQGSAYQRPDPAAARRLLDQAGWTLPAGSSVRARDGRPLELRLSTTTGDARREQLVALVAAMLAEVGIATRVDNCPANCLFGQRLFPGDFDIALAGWAGSHFAASTLKGIYETGAGGNFGRFSSPAFDAAIGRAVTTLDRAERVRLTNQASAELWSGLPALPLYQVPSVLVVADRYVGMQPSAAADGVFWNSQEWGLR